MVSASSWSCVTITVVSPSFFCSSRISTRTSCAQLGVEIGQRLVEQQDVGLDHERPRERHALLLPARQLARQALREAFEAHQAQHLRDLGRDFAPQGPCASGARTRRCPPR